MTEQLIVNPFVQSRDNRGSLQIYVADQRRGVVLVGAAAALGAALLARRATLRADPDEIARQFSGIVEPVRARQIVTGLMRRRVLTAYSDSGAGDAPPVRESIVVTSAGEGKDLPALLSSLLAGCLGDDVAQAPADTARPAITVAISGSCIDDELIDIGRRLAATRSPWLPVQLLHASVSVGPFVFPGDSPCFECSVLRHAASQIPDGLRFPPVAAARREPTDLEQIAAAGLIVTEVRRLLSGDTPLSLGAILRHEVATATVRHDVVVEAPWCASCDLGHQEAE